MPIDAPKKKHRILFYVISVVLIFALAGSIIVMALNRHKKMNDETAEKSQTEEKGPLVNVTRVQLTSSEAVLNLIGETRPMTEATIYAKLSGYLREIFVDKGDHVRAGQILARIESPETDQAFLAARADALNKSHIAKRMKVLEQRKLISAQEAEQAYAAADIARAQLHTQSVLKGYETLKAPFEGIVTARYVDPGALIQNGANSQAASLAVATVSQTSTLRIYVYVDQKNAQSIKVGLPAEIYLPDRPDQIFRGRVGRLADELDPRTRMLLTEVDYDNSKHDFVAGSFVNLRLRVPVPRMLQVPVAALVFKGEKSFLPAVSEDQRVQLKPATIIDDDGITATVACDVAPGTEVVMSLGPNIGDNAKVQVARQDEKQDGQVAIAKGQRRSGRTR